MATTNSDRSSRQRLRRGSPADPTRGGQAPLSIEGRTGQAWAAIPAQYNLGAALTRQQVAAGRGDQLCLIWENSAGLSRQFTYAEMDAASDQAAVALRGLGVERGDRVLLRMPNLPEFYIAALGAAKLGAVFIPSSTQFRAPEIAYRLRDSGAKVCITTTELAPEVEQAREQLDHDVHLVAISYGDVPMTAGQLDFWSLLTAADTTGFAPVETSHDDLAFIAYTSGTTGDPKGVVHCQRYPVAYDSLIRQWHDYREGDVCACPAEVGWLLPVASTFLYAMRAGLTIVLYHPVDGRFSPPAWFDLIRRHRISNFVGTPTIYRMLTAHAEAAEADFSSLRHGVSAGEPLPPDTIAAVERRMGFAPLDGIGMTECMVYCYNRIGRDVAAGSCGWPDDDCEIRLLDDQLQEVPDGDEGVLCVRRDSHPGMMKEYWNKPEQTAEIFRGPWYVSGDVLEKGTDGRFWFKGRADDVMKASGYRISPFEVESCLVEHPAVLEAAAVASPDPVRGSVVKAFIVLRDGHQASDRLAGELQQWVKDHQAPYKYPRLVEFVAALPKTASGKIKRRLLRESEAAPHPTERDET